MKQVNWCKPVFSRADVIELLNTVLTTFEKCGIIKRPTSAVQLITDEEFPVLAIWFIQDTPEAEHYHHFTVALDPPPKETPRN